MNFGLEKQLDRIVETLALSALMASKPSKQIEKRLREIAFPLEVMEEISENSDLTALFESEVEEWTCPVCLHTSLDDECPKCTEVYFDLKEE